MIIYLEEDPTEGVIILGPKELIGVCRVEKGRLFKEQ